MQEMILSPGDDCFEEQVFMLIDCGLGSSVGLAWNPHGFFEPSRLGGCYGVYITGCKISEVTGLLFRNLK